MKKITSVLLGALFVFAPEAKADPMFSLYQALYSAGRAAYQSCMVSNGEYSCAGVRQRLEQSAIDAGRAAQRAYGNQADFAQGGCVTYKDGCQECQGPKEESFVSPGGHKIFIDKPEQAYLQPSIKQVLMKMADENKMGITVNSAFRSCAYQKGDGKSKGPGVKNSQHLRGVAVDFRFTGSSKARHALAKIARNTLDSMGRKNSGGTGVYCTEPAHVDTRNQLGGWDWTVKPGCGQKKKKKRKK